MIVWIAGRSYEHAREANAVPKAVDSRPRGRGVSMAVDVENPRALADWFDIEGEFWTSSDVDPESRWRGWACKVTARRLRLQLDRK